MGQLDRKKILEWGETGFLLLFLLYTALGFNSITYGTPLISVVMWVTYLWGGLLLAIRLWNWKHYIKMPGLVLLLVMCAICALSIVVNRQYDFKKNVIYLIFWIFYFFMFYAQHDQADSELLKKRFRLAGHMVCLCAFILATLSLVMMFCRFSQIVQINGNEVIRGFTYGRLYGAYLTPNGGAVVASIVIFLSIHFIARYKKPAYTVFAVLNILVQFVYIVFSDSRSGTLCLSFGGAVYAGFTVLESRRFRKRSSRAVAAIALAAVALLGGMFAPGKTQDVYNDVVTMLVSSNQSGDPSQGEQEDEKLKDYIIDRGYDLSGDISNRRFDVWKSGLEIFAQKPLLGTTFCGFLPYAKEYMPETYIVNNDYMDMTTLDNDFVNLLASNGIIGFAAFFGFVVWVLVLLLRRFFAAKEKDKQLPVMMAVCMASATASMFTSGVLYMQSPFSALFWLSLGAMMIVVSGKKEEVHNG